MPTSSDAPIQRIIRFKSSGATYMGEEPEAGSSSAVVLSGDLFDGSLARTDRVLPIDKLLAPLVPTDIFCIGLNYMKHYEEGAKKRGIPMPAQPVRIMPHRCAACAT